MCFLFNDFYYIVSIWVCFQLITPHISNRISIRIAFCSYIFPSQEKKGVIMKKAKNTQEENFFKTEAGQEFLRLEEQSLKVYRELVNLADELTLFEEGWTGASEAEIAERAVILRARTQELRQQLEAMKKEKRDLLSQM